ncbi:MAG TPA: DUF3017 domain-containing protein [Actinomycetota bacterium]|nr:DUF3017 domain-containing protein [Actinomycetota bacterium]
MAAVRRQWPLLSVLAGIVLAMVFVALDRFRVGSVLLAISVLAAFFLRFVLPDSRAGLLAVRRRSIDLVVLGVLGAGLAVLSIWVPPPQ